MQSSTLFRLDADFAEMRGGLQAFAAPLDYIWSELDEFLNAKVFYSERGQGASYDHGLAQPDFSEPLRASQPPNEAASEGITCTRWVFDMLQRKGGSCEERIMAKHQATVFTLLNHDVAWAQLEEYSGGLLEICCVAKLACFRIIEQYNVNALQYLEQGIAFPFDPKFHGVA